MKNPTATAAPFITSNLSLSSRCSTYFRNQQEGYCDKPLIYG